MIAVRWPLPSHPTRHFGVCSLRAVDSKFPKHSVPLARLVPASSPGKSLLIEKLSARTDTARASKIVNEALERSGRTDLPEEPDELVSFTKAHLIDDLVAAIGGREVSGFLDDLEESARLTSGVRGRDPGSARATVVLVDNDLFRRAGLARSLVARRLNVIPASTLEDLINTRSRPAVLILDHDAALSAAFLIVLSQPGFRPAVVVRTNEHPVAATRTLERAGVDVYEIVAGATGSEVVAAVERVLERL